MNYLPMTLKTIALHCTYERRMIVTLNNNNLLLDVRTKEQIISEIKPTLSKRSNAYVRNF